MTKYTLDDILFYFVLFIVLPILTITFILQLIFLINLIFLMG